MRVSFLPLYPEWGASSRMRVYALVDELRLIGHSVQIGLAPADVCVVQKHRDLEVVRAAKEVSARVLYDFDDTEVGDVMDFVSRSVDLVTTDTEGHRSWYLWNWPGQAPCVVVPDPIDYGLKEPLSLSFGGGGCVWFGLHLNFHSVSGGLNALRMAGLPTTCISGTELGDPPYNFIRWDQARFVWDLRAFDVCVLSHLGGDLGKSANKMTTAIAAGVPCLVSATPEYSDFAAEAGVGWTVWSTPAELVRAAKRLLMPRERSRYIALTQPIAWGRFNSRAVAKQWLAAVEQL